MKTERQSIIIAPHPDDEIIGCYKILKTEDVYAVLFGKNMMEARESADEFDFNIQPWTLLEKAHIRGQEYKFYFPDPVYELHPDHRWLGAKGEEMLREGEDVTFYSTNMNAPYIQEVSYSQTKLLALNSCYEDKASLWEYDHKYFLFEGYCKWLIDA